jgi:hypothetical protein
MALDANLQQKLDEWMTAKGMGPTCPACGKPGRWRSGNVVAAPVVTGGGFRIGDNMPSMVQVICTNCAYVMLLDTQPLGIG